MAQVIVELTGDERKVLAAYQKAAAADKALRESTGKTGAEGTKASNEFAKSWIKAGDGSSRAIDGLLRQMRKAGPEGRAAAEEAEKHFRKTGTAGRQSIESLIEKLKSVDPEAASAAESIVGSLGGAADDSATALDKTLAKLVDLGPAGAKAASMIKADLRASAVDSAIAFEGIVRELEQLDPAAAESARKIQATMAEADRQSQLKETLASLRQLGPEGEIAARKIASELAQASAKAEGGFDGIIANLEKIDPAAAEAARRVKTELQQADRDSEFKVTLASMRNLGGESAEIASRIEQELSQAAAESAGSMDVLLAKLGEIDPKATEAAERIKKELSEAAKYSEGKFEGTLTKLRSMGPVGQRVASELKTHLVNAGELAEESIDDVVTALRKIDPAAADAAADIQAIATRGETAFSKFGKSAVGQITSIAGAYVGVQEVIQTIIAANQKVIQTNKEILEGLKAQESGDRRLLQVSNDAEDFQQLRGTADQLAKDYGIDRDQARNLVFSARSEGFESSAGFIAQNQQVIDVESQAQVAGQIPALFKKEGLTAEQAINATLSGATESRLSFEQIGSALPGAAEGGALAGASSTETVAALSVLASRFKSAETAADRLKAFTSKVGLDTGDDGSHEKIAKKQQAEDDRAERARTTFRGLQERVTDTKTDIERAEAGPRTDATERRLADLQIKLERAERAVKEFDQTDLTAKKIESGPTRESLQGKGIIRAVQAIKALPEEQRQDFLGESQEINAAYKILVEELDAIVSRQDVIADAVAKTGTDQSPVAIRRAAAAADPKLAATLKVAQSDNALAIDRENRRAVEEAERQEQRNQALQGAENTGASEFRIGLAENLTEGLRGFGVKNTQALIPAISGNALSNLERDLSLAQEAGDEQAGPTLLATNQLRRRRDNDANAILSPDETAQFLRSTGTDILPGEVQPEQQETLTASIIEQANQSRGLERSLSLGLLQPLANAGSFTAQAGVNSAASEGSASADKIVAALERQNEILQRIEAGQDKVADASSKAADASSKTAENTRPRPSKANADAVVRQARESK